MPTLQQVSFTTPYAADEADIERRRRLAEALQAQSAQPLDVGRSVGGWAIPISPLEGAAKMAQAWSGQYQTKKADEKQKELAQRYQDDLAAALGRAQTMAGPHPEAVDTSGEGTSSFDMSGSAGPATQMVPGNRAELIKALMSHPATQPLAMQQMQADLTREQMKQALADAGYGGTQGNPMVPGAPGSSVMAGSGATPATGSPAAPRMPAGVDPLAWALMVQKGDMEGLAKLVQEGSKPSSRFISTRYGVFAADPNNPNRVVAAGGASPPGALNYQFGPDGQPTLGLLPGQAEAAGALKAAEAKGGQPFQTGMTKVPVYLPGGDQIEVTLNPVQMERYNRTGDLPPEVASSIPGYQPPAPPQPAPGARPAGFPVETPEVAARAAEVRMRALNGELAQQQAALANAKTPADREEAQKNIDALQKEIGAKIPGARPVAGRGQTQEEGIRQQRQAAAGKAVDEQFAKDYVAFTTGGAQDATKQIAQLQDVQKQLTAPGADLTGPMRGTLPDSVQKFTAAGRNAIAMRGRVEEVVQRSLRSILGAQFTEKEGERLIARAYNPSLTESENAIRVGRLLTQLQQAYQQKQDAVQYFQKNNTLSGWQGKLPSMADFDPERVMGKNEGLPAASAGSGNVTDFSSLKPR